MTIKLEHYKEEKVFQSYWKIFVNFRFEGFMYKVKSLPEWGVYFPPFDEHFKSFKEAKQFVLKMGENYE